MNQTGHGVSHGYLECKTKTIFGIAWLGKKLAFQTEICDYFQYLIFKLSIFHRLKELFKSNQTRYGVSHVYLEWKTKRIFGIACLRKKLAFHTEICDYFQYLIFKYSIFHRAKELFKSNQTRYGVSHVYLECRTKTIFGIAWLGKKLAFQTEICDYFQYLIFKLSIFHRLKELFKSNQTRYGVSHVYLEWKTKRIFGIACLRKKLAFHTEICDYFQYLIFKYSIFHRAKELFKSNQTRYGVSHVYLECRTKTIFGIAWLGKKISFSNGNLRLFPIFNS